MIMEADQGWCQGAGDPRPRLGFRPPIDHGGAAGRTQGGRAAVCRIKVLRASRGSCGGSQDGADLAASSPVDRGAIAIASELFECRHYGSAVATCSSVLEDDPACVPLLLIRARCFIAMRRDADAQADLRTIIQLDSRCALAYRLLGELAARKDENASAAIFFRESIRLDPGDQDARDWLLVVDPAAAALPVARPSHSRAPVAQPRTATNARSLSAPARARAESPSFETRESGAPHRFARGTQSPDDDRAGQNDERPTRPQRGTIPFPLARGAQRPGQLFTPAPELDESVLPAPSAGSVDETVSIRRTGSPPMRPPLRPTPAPLPPPPTLAARPAPVRAPLPAPRRPAPRALVRSLTPELPGFGDYLVDTGVLTRERLRAAQAYQRSMKVQLATAIVTLGLATPERIEWACVTHQSQLRAASEHERST